MNESCYMYECVSRHTYEWVVSSADTHTEYEIKCVRLACSTCPTCEWVVVHIWMCHVTHMNAPRHTYECVTSYIWMRQVTHMKASYHMYDTSYHMYEWCWEWVLSHSWTSHVANTNESCNTHVRVMSHICMSHVIHMNASCHTYERVIHTHTHTHTHTNTHTCTYTHM